MKIKRRVMRREATDEREEQGFALLQRGQLLSSWQPRRDDDFTPIEGAALDDAEESRDRHDLGIREIGWGAEHGISLFETDRRHSSGVAGVAGELEAQRESCRAATATITCVALGPDDASGRRRRTPLARG